MSKFKNPQMQKMYETCLVVAADRNGEFWHQGRPRRGAGHRCAFWDGYSGLERSAHAIPGTLSWAAYRAGQAFAKREPSIVGTDAVRASRAKTPCL